MLEDSSGLRNIKGLVEWWSAAWRVMFALFMWIDFVDRPFLALRGS